MTHREKELLVRVYAVLDGLSGLRARNPADIKTISRYHAAVPKIMRSVQYVISSLGYGDLAECGEWLNDAETDLRKELAR